MSEAGFNHRAIATALGISPHVVKEAKALALQLRSKGLDDPYIPMTAKSDVLPASWGKNAGSQSDDGGNPDTSDSSNSETNPKD